MSDGAADIATRKASPLSRTERAAMALYGAINGAALGKAVQDVYLRGVGYPWMRALIGRRTLVEGMDAFAALAPDRGVMLVANHRSFFDFYAVSVAMYGGPTPWLRRLHFPVRANFVYSRPLGPVVNALAGMGVMYPPFFREREKAAVNRAGLAFLMDRLRGEPGSIVGIHPEGGRSRSDDAYHLGPLSPGAAELALKASPIVVPVFINGLSNSLKREWRAFRDPASRRDNPLVVVFGEPLAYGDLREERIGARQYKLLTDRFGEAILRCGEIEKRLRADCTAGRIADDDSRWLTNRAGGRLYATR